MASDPTQPQLFPDIFENDVKKRLPDDPVIFRYMRLSAFVMLLEGEVFVPTISKLQSNDPLESKLPLNSYRYCEDFIASLSPTDRSWLEKKVEPGFENLVQSGAEKGPRYLTEAWVTELSKRRCAWCWYHGTSQSMSQWQIYGREGVAVRSSLESLRRAIKSALEKTSCGKVQYFAVGRPHGEYFSGRPRQALPPYYFKEIAYKHEEEVRFVVALNADNYDSSAGGVILELDPAKLIEEVIITPHMHRDEAKALTKFVQDKLPNLPEGKIRKSALLFSDVRDESELLNFWVERSETPFTEVDLDGRSGVKASKLPTGLFKDI
jgi:hypothetical protein